ncbi:MAG: TIGR03364 family FAD-dependent oxidoreductase [Actinomycetota bacterium]|nr:TIGR03364 family FAD-dependent oxidoreductase [Actinomycetota bacterium]MDQ2956097.1 TIGR03364 family FAD-dependent oxidoreductase [Actinomycetota bacterium]
MTCLRPGERVDLVIVGAGIVGLAHAVAAVERGLSVAVIERDERAVGASVQNFGHGCFTAQDGRALDYARQARGVWLRLAKRAGFWIREAGTVVAARAEDELAVLAEFAARRDGEAQLLNAAGVAARVPGLAGVIGGAWLPADLRVDPRSAVAALAAWLAEQGVRFHWRTTMLGLDPDGIHTSRGLIRGTHQVVCVGHNVDRILPAIADDHGITRCDLQMLRVANPRSTEIEPAVLTGFSLLRYDGFLACSASRRVRARLAEQHSEAMAMGLNLMFTQAPDGDLIIGDTHAYDRTRDAFNDETRDEQVLSRTAELLGVDRLTIRQRWRGRYASAADPFLIAEPSPQTRVVSVTTGIGMTTAFGLAEDVLTNLLH